MLGYLALRCLSLLAPLVPARVGYWLASALGDIAYLASSRARENVTLNVTGILGKDGFAPDVVRSVFRTAARNYFDLFRIPRLHLQRFSRLVRLDGWENIEAALRLGRGVVVVTPHLGNLDAVANLTMLYGVPCTIPTESLRSDKVLRLVTKMRASQGIQILPLTGRAALREVYQALRKNGLVAIVGDRDLQGNGVVVPFFGRPTTLPSGAVGLALRTGAPILAARCLRASDGTFDVRILPALEIPRGGSKDDVRTGTAMVAAQLEAFIREAPGQWIVFERFWPSAGAASSTRLTVGAT